ncbi:antibiotic biosynthesis monooxygenase [Pseudomonas syringae group sp. J309-1]|uniref:antibiotic biosynthesis monooxygenase n=1 Tax=Pseudomonas syringae group sp. J309-1 TaxID=3079588 RepID=UPI0029076CF6|nr:antibiotic biosynthesis monooxygenase [Pseudomonas syringae group sp. J309-1]MDU8361495.1 antibiotic biosynthesis monooxygenase [Pseudomonas syringae group sp. J309-1]
MASAEENLRFNQLIEFTVSPAQQSGLVTALTEQVERYTCTYPGFISATVQASDDGCRVLGQTLWRSRRASEEALLNAEANEQDFMTLLRRHQVSAVTFNSWQVSRTIQARS